MNASGTKASESHGQYRLSRRTMCTLAPTFNSAHAGNSSDSVGSGVDPSLTCHNATCKGDSCSCWPVAPSVENASAFKSAPAVKMQTRAVKALRARGRERQELRVHGRTSHFQRAQDLQQRIRPLLQRAMGVERRRARVGHHGRPLRFLCPHHQAMAQGSPLPYYDSYDRVDTTVATHTLLMPRRASLPRTAAWISMAAPSSCQSFDSTPLCAIDRDRQQTASTG